MVNRPEWIDAMFAIMKIGAVLVPVNTRFRTDDMAYILAQSDADAVLLADRSGPVDYLGMIREIVPALGSRPDPRFPCLRHVVVLADRPDHGVADWHEVLDRGTSVTAAALRERAARVYPEDPAFIFYTSGTTGFPKGAVHGHRMIRNAWDHGDRMGLTVDDVILMYLPLFHAFGFIEGPLMSMIRGARQVLTEAFDGGHCLDLIASERATIIHGFDTHYQELLGAGAKPPGRVERADRDLRHRHVELDPHRASGAKDVRQSHDRVRDERGRHRRDLLLPRLDRGAVRGGQRLSRLRLRGAHHRSGDGGRPVGVGAG